MAAITRLSSFGYGTRRNGNFYGQNAPPVVVPGSGELAFVVVVEALVTAAVLADAVRSLTTLSDAVVVLDQAQDFSEITVTVTEGVVTALAITEAGDHE